MEDKKEKIEKLAWELYILKYTTRMRGTLQLGNILLNHYLLHDMRFEYFYESFINNDEYKDYNKIDFLKHLYDNNKVGLAKFINDYCLDDRQEFMYEDKAYPMHFVLYNEYSKTFDEFLMDMCGRTLTYIYNKNKNCDHISTDMIANCRIKYLTEAIAREKERISNEEEEVKEIKHIKKYDKNSALITTYESRKECCEKEGFKKAALSAHLSGNRKTLKGYIYKEIVIQQKKNIDWYKGLI